MAPSGFYVPFIFFIVPPLSAGRFPLVIRYAVLDPEPARGYLYRDGLPMLRSTICLVERNLVPVFEETMHTQISYVFYTDSTTHTAVNALLTKYYPGILQRVRLINLDEDPNDNARVASIGRLNLNPVNTASVRRTLADTVHLSSEMGRLLLGLDVSFVDQASDLVAQIARLSTKQAVYLEDRFKKVEPDPGGGLRMVYEPYRLPAYAGPQCPGLLGDFVYLSPGLDLTVGKLLEKITWYSQLPRVPWRTSPPHPLLGGFHAVDQFALNLALAESVVPQGERGCHPLNHRLYRQGFSFVTGVPNISGGVQALHDKIVSSCGMHGYDQCRGIVENQIRDAPDRALSYSSIRCRCLFHDGFIVRCSAYNGKATREYLKYKEIGLFLLTLCFLEHALKSTGDKDILKLPAYTIYTNDQTCDRMSRLLQHEFPDLAARLKVVNLVQVAVNEERSQEVSVGATICMRPRSNSEPLLAFDVTFLVWRNALRLLVSRANRSTYFQMMDYVQLSDDTANGIVQATLFFCYCGTIANLGCPSELHDPTERFLERFIVGDDK